MTRPLVATALLCVLGACDSKPSDVREWQATDHDHATEPAPNGPTRPGARRTPARPKIPGVSDLTLTAWKNQCVSCHGHMGRGDGPMGASVGAIDLTSPATQHRSDDEIDTVIKSGRGKMPGFDLPEDTRAELVRLIRLFGGAQPAPPTGSGAPSATPRPSAATPAPRASR